ncbi:DUF58 domain-containing protein [Hydrogenimonas sp.]
MNSLRTFLRIRRRVRQRVTKQSVFLLVLLLGLFLEAYMHNFNLVYITLFFLVGAAMAAAALGILNVGRLEAGCQGCGRLFANRPGTCRFAVRNDADSPAWGVDLVCGDSRVPLGPLSAHAAAAAALPVAPARRGEWSPGACRLESLFPLGTVRVELPLAERCRALVYPEPKGRPLESFLRQVRSPVGHENDFEGLEEYSGVQSLSRIHWPSVAKGEPMVKRFDREEDARTLVFDFEGAGPDDEARLSQLTLWALECEKRGLDFAVRLPGRVLESKKEGVDGILTALARY